ncbi:mechanosensitive ion channel domain-containing protein [Cyanobacterium aponinum UTEX 3222]|uniref:mechanosensitive ion channel domain-containing protein n=1 Tax=Cyanobacterium aponinum TaxID=379064 RepID=UPI0016816C8F|nr:mechanosensitive ion channel domain-containing protein [Cyanobacterium aponinum]MBD2396036.1 mechanosensitive ion channel [Cyanobacterium aponinum FACHB-4101]WRL37031.1 mechanosensitive ion channel domain-containing protein [Cyanobacterium aponinum UTEX 3221]WRL43365.1 mechanosensitive ion channel domain-containing protein [Cyanobacterium aponinum UTEX 3222]
MLEGLTNVFTTPLFFVSAKGISLWWILQVILLLLIVSFIAKFSKKILKNKLLLTLKINDSNREVISTFIAFAVATMGYIIVIQAMGINLTSLAVIVGGLGVGIGFGFQDLTRNLISGFTLLGEGKLKVGDLIEFQGKLGYIREISIRCTVINMIDGSELIVPNTELTNNTVINWNYDNCHGRIEVEIGVAYGSDLLLVTDVLLQSALTVKQILLNPHPQVIFLGFGDNSLNFALWIWVEKINLKPFIKSSLLYIIEYNFKQNNIDIPFPQRDVWLHNVNSKENRNINFSQASQKDKSLRELLKQISLFHDFNDLQLIHLIEMGYQKYLQPEEILIKQGEYGDFFALILQGEVEAILEANTTEKIIFYFREGQYFGELPLLLNIPYPTTMKTNQKTRLLLIKKDNFNYLIKEYPFVGEQIVQELTQRQDILNNCHKQLKEMGLLKNEEDKNPILSMIRQYFQQIFVG